MVQETLPTGSYDRLARGSDGVGAGAHTTSSFTADAAAEYSLTRSWVLAFDVVYQHNDSTRVTGRAGPGLRGALLVQVEKAFRAPTPDSDGELMTVVNVRLGECVLMSRSLNGDAGSASNELTASGLRSELRVERGAEL